MKNSFKTSAVALVLILFIAAAFRVPGIYWGDGDLVEGRFARWHTDETTHVNIAKQFLKGDIDYGSNYVKGFGLQMAIAAAVKAIFSSHVSTDDIYRIGRWISLFYSLAIIVLLYIAIVLISGDRFLAIIAASFMSVCSLAVMNSHFAVADSASSFWLWVTAFLCYYGINKPSDRSKLCAWATCGMALAIKVSISACAPIIILIIVSKKRLKDPAVGLAIAFTVFMLANGCGVGADGLHAIISKILNDNIKVIPHHTRLETFFTLFISIFPAYSISIILLSIAGVYLLIKYLRNFPILYACFGAPVVVYSVLLLMLDDPFERHILPFTPLLCGLSAYTWKKILSGSKNLTTKCCWSIPLGLYLICFAIDGELVFWRDNRIDARQWILNEVEPGSSVLEGPYAWLYLPGAKYEIDEIPLRSYEVPVIGDYNVIVLHEFHTYRYGRSRLSPFRKPDKNNIYHPDGFSLEYLDKLKTGETQFELVRVLPISESWTLERFLYKKYWGTFQCFVGDVYIYQKRN